LDRLYDTDRQWTVGRPVALENRQRHGREAVRVVWAAAHVSGAGTHAFRRAVHFLRGGRNMGKLRFCVLIFAFNSILLGARASWAAGTNAGKIPVTTSSEEARRLYLQGRDLQEKLRVTDAHKLFQEAVTHDPDFALGYVGLANTAPSGREFFEDLHAAVARAGNVSEGERLIIQGAEAGAKGEPARQRELYTRLVNAYPNDERAHNLLGTYYFAQQDYPAAISSLKKSAT